MISPDNMEIVFQNKKLLKDFLPFIECNQELLELFVEKKFNCTKRWYIQQFHSLFHGLLWGGRYIKFYVVYKNHINSSVNQLFFDCYCVNALHINFVCGRYDKVMPKQYQQVTQILYTESTITFLEAPPQNMWPIEAQ